MRGDPCFDMVVDPQPIQNGRMAKKRGYSDEFPTTGKTHRYMLDYIPAPLWRAVRAKAKREGISLRTLILKLLTEWIGR